MRLDQFPELDQDTEEGTDVTEALRVTKYEIPQHQPGMPNRTKDRSKLVGVQSMLGTITDHNRPEGVPHTDESRIQSVPWLLKEFEGKDYYFTLKMDGTSLTIYCINGVVGACSRKCTVSVDEENLATKIINKYDLFKKLPAHFGSENVAIQGELCGPGIQGNRAKLRDHDWFVFDIFSITENSYREFERLVSDVDSLKLTDAPLIECGETFKAHQNQEYWLSKAAAATYNSEQIAMRETNAKPTPAEGIVVRTEHGFTAKGQRSSFKTINNKYLLKYDE